MIAKMHFIIELKDHALEEEKDQKGSSMNLI